MSTFLTTGALKQDIVEITASSLTPLALTSLSPTIHRVKGTDTQEITLPDALTLEIGIHYVIVNDSSKIVTVKDFSSATIETLTTGFSTTFYLSSKATSAGVWGKVSSSVLFGDKNLKLISGGIWSWTFSTQTLAWSSNAFVVVPGFANTVNMIPTGSVVIATGFVAYVILNKEVGLPNLTVYTALPINVPTNNSNVLILAYRDGSDVIVGSSSLRLIDGQSSEIDQGLSRNTRTLLGSSITPATSSPDWSGRGAPLRTIVDSPTQGLTDAIVSIDTEIDNFFGQLRLMPDGVLVDAINITGTDRTMLNSEILSQELGSRVLAFDGAHINFSTGVITTPLGGALGLNFTPYAVPLGEYYWYCLVVEYTGTTALGQSTARVRVGLASSSNADPALALFPQFPALFRSKPLGFIQVYNNAGSIETAAIRQLGVGSGSGGGGSGLISVRAADFVTTTLPTGATLTVDGVTIVNEDMVLYGNAALNRVYKVTGIGSSISFEEISVFTNGNVIPQDGNEVAVADGNSNDVIWEWDSGTSTWTFISLSTENKQWLGLDVPTKTGGVFTTKVDPLGQTNNVVVEGETIEKTLKRLDIRPDVLKRVRVIDLTTTTLPSTASVVIDGITLVDGDKVLYGSVALLGIYQVAGIGVSATWTKLNEFGGSKTPSAHDAVLIREGSADNCTIWLYDSSLTPPWHRVSGPATTIWTGTTPYNTPSWDGTLSSADTTLKLALDTIDKYFRGLQLRRHLTDSNRVTILASATTKTDLTILNFTIADRLLSFAGAEIDFENGVIYAANGITVIGTFTPQVITSGEYFWYAIGLNSATAGSDNTINPQIVITFATGSGTTPTLAPKPSLTARYTLGAVVVLSSGSGVIAPITQSAIVYLGQFTGSTNLEATVAQNTLDIAALQAYCSSVPQQQKFTVGIGGQSVFNLTTFTISASNAVFDVDYLIDGRWQTQSVTGDFLDGGAVKKNSTTQVQTAETVPEGKEFIVIKRTMSGGYPLVDLTGITVDLGFITPKTVGTLARPASSLILQDKVTSDIWEVEVSSGVLQKIKIN